MELTLVTFAIAFDIYFQLIVLQVIWAIGISMIILAFLQKISYRFILIIGVLIVLGHNLLDILEAAQGFKGGFWWDLLHHGSFSAMYPISEGHTLVLMYPFLPWLGLCLWAIVLVCFSPINIHKANAKAFL